ncbi:N-acetylmuramoyl-L-alanine amidase family protein [Streptococcus pseudopneumoniae]|uniref:N-acetylmuramoyl-L-alanine amidase family protein n=1 Tax=Streptococcus pseudopneumoniae TaxID=257758 RepID=UPI00110C3A6F|nr:N-acetylmuramoyl-L-alanine amidase family protein [Streptococcus pseudopneumoniae]TMR43288.1 N-acetylmuramoyl-L-alanine amidase family protein [Streptococcus pseudopneumoniae]TMR54742.1 N-acetylmuramoyl-L-alanine amidase family protein [Streptococcus pseudopneumoniae]
MKKIVLTTTAVLSLVATGATISSVNAADIPMVKVWSPAANAYVEVPAIGYRDTDLVATDVTLVEKRKAQLGAFSKGNSEFITVDYVDKAYRQEFSKQFASFESNYLARFNGKTIVFKATDYGIYTMKFELNGTLYKLTADVRENLGKGGPFYTYVTKLEVLSTNQANTISNTSTEKQIEATITKVEIDYFGLSFEGKISEPLQHGGDKAAKGNITLIDKNSGKVVYQSHNAVIFSGLTKDVSDQFLLPLIYSNQFKGDIFVSKQFPAGTYILEMSGEAGSPYDHLTDTRKRVFKVRKEVTIGNPSTNSNTNTTTQSGSNSSSSSTSTSSSSGNYSNTDTTMTPHQSKSTWMYSNGRWWYKHEDGTYTANGWEKINGVWYHFDNSGWMQTGWVKDGSWYYLDGSGAMKTGWLKDNGSWYYLQDSGAMKTGWMKVSGKWYYAYSSGVLAINTTTPDGYRVNYNGEWV